MIKVTHGYLKAGHPITDAERARIAHDWEQATKSGKTLVLYDIDLIPLPTPQPVKKVKRRNRNL